MDMHTYYSINGFKLICEDNISYTDDGLPLAVPRVGEKEKLCEILRHIAGKVTNHLADFNNLQEGYKCSPYYVRGEIGSDCVNCADPIFIKLNKAFEIASLSMNKFNKQILSNNYTIDEVKTLNREVLSSLSIMKDLNEQYSDSIQNAFNFEDVSLSFIKWIGITSGLLGVSALAISYTTPKLDSGIAQIDTIFNWGVLFTGVAAIDAMYMYFSHNDFEHKLNNINSYIEHLNSDLTVIGDSLNLF